MAANIQEFKSSFTSDLARASRFDVYISIPYAFGAYLPVTTESLAFRCESAELPGRTISTTDLKIYGPTEKLPYQTTYNDMTLTFIVSDTMEEKALFDLWLDQINPQDSHNFEYKQSYATDITIKQYDVVNNLTYAIQLIDAFPISVNQLDLNWSNDGTHKLTVTFAYTEWKQNYVGPQAPIEAAMPNTLPIAAILQGVSLAMSAKRALASGNPFALLSVAGAASSMAPTLGMNGTLSSVLNGNSAGSVGNKDVLNDKLASSVNSGKNSINLGSLF